MERRRSRRAFRPWSRSYICETSKGRKGIRVGRAPNAVILWKCLRQAIRPTQKKVCLPMRTSQSGMVLVSILVKFSHWGRAALEEVWLLQWIWNCDPGGCQLTAVFLWREIWAAHPQGTHSLSLLQHRPTHSPSALGEHFHHLCHGLLLLRGNTGREKKVG